MQGNNKFTLLNSKKARRRIISNKSHDVYLDRDLSESADKPQLIEQIEMLENNIKETKRNILAEREINLMLREENENLRLINKTLSKQEATSKKPRNQYE